MDYRHTSQNAALRRQGERRYDGNKSTSPTFPTLLSQFLILFIKFPAPLLDFSHYASLSPGKCRFYNFPYATCFLARLFFGLSPPHCPPPSHLSHIINLSIFILNNSYRNYSRYWHHFWDYRFGNCFTFNGGVNDYGESQKVLISHNTGPNGGDLRLFFVVVRYY